MTKTKSTKRALLMSALAMLMCVSMLIGSTFAWFTDSAASGSNVITAGNLDIVVEYTLGDKDTEGNFVWKNLDGVTDLFQKGPWEPGHTEVVLLRITNNGSLALKYVANMNIVNETVGKTKDNKDIILSEILTVSTCTQQYTDGNGDVASGADIFPAMTFEGAKDADGWIGYQTTSTFKAGNVLKNDKQLQPKESDYIAVKVDMAETVGNEANHDGVNIPSIEFGINVLATQYTYENDSFGNQYDKDATHEDLGINKVKTAAEFVYAMNNLKSGETVKLMNDIELGNVDIVLQDWTVTGTTEENGATVNVVEYANKVYNIDLNGHELSATDHAIELHGGTLNIKNGTISMDSATQDGTFITVGGHSPVYDAHKVAKCGQAAYNPASVLNLENVTFVGSSAVDGGFATSGHAIYVTCHGQVHIRNCAFDLVMENGVYANPFDVYNNASDGVGDGSGSATVVYVYEGTKFYGDPTYQAWKDAVNTDWEVNGGIRVYIADGYKLEAAPIADGDTYAWYTVVAE